MAFSRRRLFKSCLHTREHSQWFSVVGFRDQCARVIDVSDPPGLINQEDAGHAQFEKVLHLKIRLSGFRPLVSKNRVRDIVGLDEALDQLWPIRYHHQHLCVVRLEFFVVMTQLRHMIGAMRSGKADIKNQQRVGGFEDFGEGENSSGMIRKRKVRGSVANLELCHIGQLYLIIKFLKKCGSELWE